MRIHQTIGLDTLGDCNTADDNARFIAAVETAVESEYPDADITVELNQRFAAGQRSNISVFDYADYTVYSDMVDIIDNVQAITNRIWGEVDY